MEHSDFVHLHLHTEYSLLDGACRILDNHRAPGNLIQRASQYKLAALGITDHGNMFGTIDFYQACVNSGIKPIIGCEVYVAPQSRYVKEGSSISEAANHLILLARDRTGYKNLMRLVSIGYLEGFYYRPRIDKEVLKDYSEGLVCLTGCLKSEFSRAILNDDQDKAKKAISFYGEIFGKENFYLELIDNGISEQRKVCRELIRLGKQMEIPLVATNDCHYVDKADAYAQEILLCIGTGRTLDDPSHLKFSTEEFYFKSPQEMKQIFAEVPEAISNTMEITEKCNLQLDFETIHLPDYKVPENYNLDEYLRNLCEQGLKKRYAEVTPDIRRRLDYELSVISRMGFASYFLIVWDFIEYAKRQKIMVGPGRGSGAGSFVAYLLGITELDPLKYGLLFERFLNPGRKSMPDLDIDFADNGRDRAIDYVKAKYGQKNVAQIITFGTMLARAVVRDTGRVLNVPLTEVDGIAKLIPFGETIQEALQLVPELNRRYETDGVVRNLLDTAQRIEGLKRHTGVHAAGIVITPGEMVNYVPLAKSGKNVVTTQYEDTALIRLGLLKIDFLGLRTLTVIDEALKLISKRAKEAPKEPSDIPLDDGKTYKLLAEAKSAGVFQLESAGMRDLLRKLEPTEFSDLIALVALYRPGPIGSGMVDEFVARKHKRAKIDYEHPLLEPILKDTYGIILYQEDVMRIATELAGFTPEQADVLRQAMGKKIPIEIERQRENFVKGAGKEGISVGKANRIFDAMVKFGGYGFNKSHASAYALLAYQTAWLKANYPLEYMTVLLSSEMENTDKIVEYMAKCQQMGTAVLPPSVEKSFSEFRIENGSIRFGLLAIKNVGQGAIDSIVGARESEGVFKSLYDFCVQVDLRLVNRRTIESLIKAGCFDSLGQPRAQLFKGLDLVLEKASRAQKERLSGQTSFLDLVDSTFREVEELPPSKEWQENKLLAYEKEVLGFYVTGHPLARFSEEMKNYVSHSIDKLRELGTKSQVTIGGIISSLNKRKTKKGQLMAIFKLEDLTGMVEVVVFPEAYDNGIGKYLRRDEMVIVKGRVNWWEEKPRIVASEVIPFSRAKELLIHQMTLKLSTAGLEEATLKKLKELFMKNRGSCQVNFSLSAPRNIIVNISSKIQVKLSDEFLEEVKKLVGRDSIQLSG
ncbi:MAG: DNA polymerase III subunit alpha [bacterium]